MFWTSRRAESYGDEAELTARLNAHAGDIADYLDEVVAVRPADLGRLGPLPEAKSGAMLSHLTRGIDRFELDYRASAPFYLDAAIAHEPGWRVAVDGKRVAAVRGDFGAIAAAIPAGAGPIEFRYVDRESELFFASRILMGLAGVAALLWLAVGALRKGGGRNGEVAL